MGLGNKYSNYVQLHQIKKPWQPFDSGRFTLQCESYQKSTLLPRVTTGSGRTDKCNTSPAKCLGSWIHTVLNRGLHHSATGQMKPGCTFCPTVPNGWAVISCSKAGSNQERKCLQSWWLSTKCLPAQGAANIGALAHTCTQTEVAEAVNNPTFWHPSLKSATLT